MRNIERFRKVRHMIPETDPTTSATMIVSSTVIGNISGQVLGANFEVSIWASSAPIFIGFTSGLTASTGFELTEEQRLDLMVESALWSRIINSATGKIVAIVWD